MNKRKSNNEEVDKPIFTMCDKVKSGQGATNLLLLLYHHHPEHHAETIICTQHVPDILKLMFCLKPVQDMLRGRLHERFNVRFACKSQCNIALRILKNR
jgi:hypothetical protein